MPHPRSKDTDALLFIDTNIFLDFYRKADGGLALKFMKQVEECKDRLILSSQLEMEYLTNRQSAVLLGLGNFGKLDWSGMSSPVITSETKAAKKIGDLKRDVAAQQKRVSLKIERILKDPSRHDEIYKVLQQVFRHKSPYNLDREDPKRHEIRELAKNRFQLGYPPRKANDTSMGDAIHWEWIIRCARDSKKHIVIVTRDRDFGPEYRGKGFLNDWLQQEFKQRVGHRRRITVTPKLSDGLTGIHAQVSAEMREYEEQSLDLRGESPVE
jgi:hypothetical protein